MAIIKCDGATCTYHRFGDCIAERIVIRNEEVETVEFGTFEEQTCKTYKHSKDWRLYEGEK